MIHKIVEIIVCLVAQMFVQEAAQVNVAVVVGKDVEAVAKRHVAAIAKQRVATHAIPRVPEAVKVVVRALAVERVQMDAELVVVQIVIRLVREHVKGPAVAHVGQVAAQIATTHQK